MCIYRIFKCIFKSPPPKPDQSVIPLFFGGERVKDRKEKNLHLFRNGGEKNKIISGRDIAAAKSKEKEHPRGRKANPALGSLGKTFPGKLFLLGMCRGKAGPAESLGAAAAPKKAFFGINFGLVAPPARKFPLS